ncbi:MAG TPA: methyltransferase [Acidisoma sp.]|nr:methyltransferase [Acidisoma sp.]
MTARGGARDPRVEQAFATVPREPFAGPGPWFIMPLGPWPLAPGRPRYVRTPNDEPAFLYQDVLIALDPARGINIGEPSLHARGLDSLRLNRGETVVQVGTGSGYYTAIMAQLVGPSGQVHGFEIDRELAGRATRNLAPWPWVTIQARSGTMGGLPEADAVYVNAAITQPHESWLEALRPGGRLLFPLQAVGELGGMLLVHKPRDDGLSWAARFVSRARFISCETQQDEAIGRRLAAAFEDGRWDRVKSLRLDNKPDETCWFNGGGWWLSTDP